MTSSSRPFVLEACVETIQQGLLAEKNHADRIEFCQKLDRGGIPPDYNLIRTAVNKIKSMPIEDKVEEEEIEEDDEEPMGLMARRA